MTCAILVPSLNRPQYLERLVENIHAATPEEHRVLFCVSDNESKAILDRLGEWYLDDSDTEDRRYVTRMNKLVRGLIAADTIFFGSDDIRFKPGWLSAALAVLDTGPDVVVVNDLRNPNGTQAVIRANYLDRAVFDAPGDAFHGGYLHNFADTEMFFTAYKRGTFARAMDSIVEHLHPLFQGHEAIPWDATYTNAMRGWGHDEALFNARAQIIDRTL
jgi:hypothetical protein